MSQLSEQLNIYLERSGFTIAQLAKTCGIERSTLFQYLHGKRALKNQAHLNQIMHCLYITPTEKAALVQLFQIELIGYDLFKQRERMEQFICNLPALSKSPQSVLTRDSEQPCNSPDLHPGAICGEQELSQTVYALLYAAKCSHTPVRIMMQPHDASLMNLLLHPAFSSSDVPVTHIVCIDTSSRNQALHNVDYVQVILKYLLTLNHYRPMYYYGQVSEHFGPTNVLPNLFLTEHGVLEISVKENTAVLHTEPAVIALFQDAFHKVEQECQVFGNIYKGLMEQVSFYSDFIEAESHDASLELCSGFCSVPFWTRNLIETYINRQLPNIELLIEKLSAYCSSLYQTKRAGIIHLLINPASVRDFLQSGVIREYPEVFFSKPLSKEDRRMVLDRILAANEEGWYHIQFIKENYFAADCKWELAAQHNVATIQHFYQDTFPTLIIQESGFVQALRDYYMALLQSERAMSEEETVRLIKEWMDSTL